MYTDRPAVYIVNKDFCLKRVFSFASYSPHPSSFFSNIHLLCDFYDFFLILSTMTCVAVSTECRLDYFPPCVKIPFDSALLVECADK